MKVVIDDTAFECDEQDNWSYTDATGQVHRLDRDSNDIELANALSYLEDNWFQWQDAE